MKLHRAEGLLDLEEIQSKKVVFLGLGSLGSLTLGNLAYPWGQIVLVDPQDLEVHNVERHLLGMDDVGTSKASAIARWLSNRGIAGSTITVCPVEADEALETHSDADLLVVNIDNKTACAQVNRWCIKQNIPALYGGVYPKGTGGHIIVVPNPREQCYECAEHMMGGDYQGHLDADYGIDPLRVQDVAPKAVPALRWAINSLASDMAGYALDLLKGGEIASQVYIRAHTWEPILVLGGAELTSVAEFVVSQPALGLMPNLRLEATDSGEYELKVRRGSLSLQLRKWDMCPAHSADVTAEEI